MKLAIILMVYFSPFVFAAERITTASIADVQSFVAKKKADLGAEAVLAVFDFDNTLMAMNSDLGSDQWYQWQSAVLKSGDKTLAMVANRSELFELHYKLFAIGSMHPVEKVTAATVKAIQEMGVKTFVLTSRGSELRNDTEMELDRAGIDFSANSPGPAGGYAAKFVLSDGETGKETRPVGYQNGILMGSGQNKGTILKSFLKKIEAKFKAIIVVDDTLRNIENIEDEFKDEKSLTLFYYTHEADRVKKFEKDKTKAWKEWKKLKPALELFKIEDSKFDN